MRWGLSAITSSGRAPHRCAARRSRRVTMRLGRSRGGRSRFANAITGSARSARSDRQRRDRPGVGAACRVAAAFSPGRAEPVAQGARRWTDALHAADHATAPGSPLVQAVDALDSMARANRLRLEISASPWELAVALAGLLARRPRDRTGSEAGAAAATRDCVASLARTVAAAATSTTPRPTVVASDPQQERSGLIARRTTPPPLTPLPSLPPLYHDPLVRAIVRQVTIRDDAVITIQRVRQCETTRNDSQLPDSR
jgi:hypothetical protein